MSLNANSGCAAFIIKQKSVVKKSLISAKYLIKYSLRALKKIQATIKAVFRFYSFLLLSM